MDVNPASSVGINPAQNTQRCPSQARKSGQSHPQIGEILRPSITRIWQTKSFVLAAATSNLRPSVYFPAQTSHRMLDLLLSNWNNCVWKWELGPNLAIWGWLGWSFSWWWWCCCCCWWWWWWWWWWSTTGWWKLDLIFPRSFKITYIEHKPRASVWREDAVHPRQLRRHLMDGNAGVRLREMLTDWNVQLERQAMKRAVLCNCFLLEVWVVQRQDVQFGPWHLCFGSMLIAAVGWELNHLGTAIA